MANLLSTMRKSPPAAALAPTAPTMPPPTQPNIPRDMPPSTISPAARAAASDPAARAQTTPTRTLVVGREIILSGEISACDRLVVEGTVKANIKDCRDIAIAEGGLFTGSAAVESAEVRGRFEGELTVSGRLFIRSSGEISAAVRYREIEIERGGRLSGNVQASDVAKKAGDAGKAS